MVDGKAFKGRIFNQKRIKSEDDIILFGKKNMQEFGGSWTEEKLMRLKKYLSFYTTALKNQPFATAYIDAFAGTGYRTLRRGDAPTQLMFPELVDQEARQFLDGSARIALQIQPRFNRYIFIEKDKKRLEELFKLKDEFPDLSKQIEVVQADANVWIKDRCLNYNWKRHRAVLFLDPYGMEVEWETIAAIAKTEAIDLWLLFPLGVAVNRLLRRDGNLEESIVNKLNKFFGEPEWINEFYKDEPIAPLLSPEKRIKKAIDADGISNYFVRRLESVFTGVSERPLRLVNSKNNPLFLLCFAVGNKRGAPLALKAADHILRG